MDSGTPESTRETPLSCLIYYHIGISRDLHLLLGGRNCPKPVLAFSLGRFEEFDLYIYQIAKAILLAPQGRCTPFDGGHEGAGLLVLRD